MGIRILGLAILLLPPGWSRGQEVVAPWPEAVAPQEAQVGPAEKTASGSVTYRSRFFELRSPRPIREARLREILQVMDTVPAAVKAVPLPLYQPPASERPVIEVLADADSFRAAGGGENMAGAYLNRRECILLRADVLFGEMASAPGTPGRRKDLNLLVHETTHLAMHRLNGNTPPWFTEGCAEYFTALRREDGRFVFTAPEAAIRAQLAFYLGQGLNRFPVSPVPRITALDGEQWTKWVGELPERKRYRPYATSLLLVHYFLNGGEARRDQLRRYLEAVMRPPAPRPGPASPWRFRGPPPPRPALELPAPADLQAALTAFWLKQGVRIDFDE